MGACYMIITGGTLKVPFLKEQIDSVQPDYIVCVDGALELLFANGISFDVLVGDFDTADPELVLKYREMSANHKIHFMEYNPKKDYTDTDIALRYVMEQKPEKVVILGGTGTRLDHTLANIHLLYQMLPLSQSGYLIDEYNKIYATDCDITISKASQYGEYVSLIPLNDKVEGLTLEGFKYNTRDITLERNVSLGISNEIEAQEATIRIASGVLMVIEVKD
ncbi:MAG: thiamine diphosphokinase [Lachnospiraceae bacterium]|nr:thiamine diphosphokinase [Lachnospiraceae bacterium]